MKKTDEGNTGLRKVDSRCRGGSSWEGEEGKEENEATCRSLTETVSTNTRQVPRRGYRYLYSAKNSLRYL